MRPGVTRSHRRRSSTTASDGGSAERSSSCRVLARGRRDRDRRGRRRRVRGRRHRCSGRSPHRIGARHPPRRRSRQIPRGDRRARGDRTISTDRRSARLDSRSRCRHRPPSPARHASGLASLPYHAPDADPARRADPRATDPRRRRRRQDRPPGADLPRARRLHRRDRRRRPGRPRRHRDATGRRSSSST